jgi:hypothetical protein
MALRDPPQRPSEARLEARSLSEIIDLTINELGNPDVREQVFRGINDSFNFFIAGTDGLHVRARPISLIKPKKLETSLPLWNPNWRSCQRRFIIFCSRRLGRAAR